VRTGAELHLQAQLHQEMRAAMDLVTRDLRRARHWSDAFSATVAPPSGMATPRNPYQAMSPASEPASEVVYAYQPPPEDTRTSFRFRLSEDGVLRMKIGDAPAQPLTDDTLFKVTGFTITPKTTVLSLEDACLTPCPPGAPCPTLSITVLDITLMARSTRRPEIERRLSTRVRPRNDAVEGLCPV
jgi:hypothetical protein